MHGAGGVSMQTSAGVDVRKLEAEDDDAPMKLPTVGLDLRLAIAQARQVLCRGRKPTFLSTKNPQNNKNGEEKKNTQSCEACVVTQHGMDGAMMCFMADFQSLSRDRSSAFAVCTVCSVEKKRTTRIHNSCLVRVWILQAKGISQKDLAAKLMIPAKTIQVRARMAFCRRRSVLVWPKFSTCTARIQISLSKSVAQSCRRPNLQNRSFQNTSGLAHDHDAQFGCWDVAMETGANTGLHRLQNTATAARLATNCFAWISFMANSSRE
jgi:hypothetical protein